MLILLSSHFVLLAVFWLHQSSLSPVFSHILFFEWFFSRTFILLVSLLVQFQFLQFNLNFHLFSHPLLLSVSFVLCNTLYSLYWVVDLICNHILICVIICVMFAYPLYCKLYHRKTQYAS